MTDPSVRPRLACATFAFQGLPLDATFERVGALGFSFLDLSVHHDPVWGHATPSDLRNDPLAILEQIEAAERRHHVSVAAITLSTKMDSVSERGDVEAVVKLARRARVAVVSVMAGKRDEVVELRRLKDFVVLGTDHGVQICVETHGDSAFIDPGVAVDWVGGVSGLKLTLDTGHLLSRGVKQAAWAALLPKVGHVHLKDAGTTPDRYQVPVGAGELDVPALVQGLTAAGFAGTYTVEYVGRRREDAKAFDAEPELRAMRLAVERAVADSPEVSADRR